MKILIVNTFDRGGAANSCKRLHLGLLNSGVESKVLLKTKTKNWLNSFRFISTVRSLTLSEKIKNKIQRIAKELKLYNPSSKNSNCNAEQKFLKNRPAGLEMFSFPLSNYDITQTELYQEADVINLHWVANFLDFQSFFKKNTKPVVWTLHDMNPFTGGEHYVEFSLGIDKNGKPLERKLTIQEKKQSKLNLELKKEALRSIQNLHVVAPSQWVAGEAKKSELFNAYPVYHIPYGLDADIYKPVDKVFARHLLNIPDNKKVILFVADSIDNNRKGFIYLQKALEELSYKKDLILCAIGKASNSLKTPNTINLGTIDDERLMCAAYSAADVFVIPSLMDNLPNTVLESLMCGTPAIGFPVGGIPEMVKNGENGLIAKNISILALKRCLINFFENPEKFDRDTIRRNAVKKYNQEIQANSYINLFRQINT